MGRRQANELSPRKKEVLALVARGMLSKTVAHRLGLTEGTVKAHLAGVSKITGAVSRVETALWYLANCDPAELDAILDPWRTAVVEDAQAAAAAQPETQAQGRDAAGPHAGA